MARSRKTNPGILLGVAAFSIWGLLPAFLKLLKPLPAPDILAHRILWSLLLLALLAAALRHGPALLRIVRTPRLLLALTGSAALIAINWLCYIVAVNGGHVAEASLGYFINPLVNVVLGVVILRERLGRIEAIAVIIATAAVLFLAIWQGGIPVIPLTLAFSFGFYGLIRKITPVDAIDGLLIETAILTPPALGWLLLAGTALSANGPGVPLLVATGILTALPLLLFAAAAKRVRYTDLGLLQYIAPTLQLVLAVFVYGEKLYPAQIGAFALIWIALALYALGASIGARRHAPAVPD
ncbi:EamA family transporter RarD [Sphingomonas sp. So64.6b]|nr:EamA family transporter RarD [Sphingomonas sp. So64.6b]